MSKNQTTLIVLGGLVLIIAIMWFTGSFEKLLSGEPVEQVGNTVPLDLEQLQITIRTVSSPVIEELQFVETIDTLRASESLDKLRNPFVKVYVAPPPSAVKPKASTTKKSTPTPTRKKRIVRPKIEINAIIWDLSSPYAILNNEIYGEGDIISGYTVQTIHDTMVVLANKDDLFSIVIERE
ncbi:MAG: hypothetical protein K9N35_11485 [Candidatus Marinimicrobia bacterium]|nr:hypothetical protein [Candidatus Neomarinimicrobiota bacterium]